jgi:glycosyltransferase involved in cell wall biosynthesis
MPREKIIVVRNGIKVGDFLSPAPEVQRKDVVIGIIARLVPVKDIPTLLHAMHRVIQAESNVRLEVVGDGPERAALEALSTKLGLQNHVSFLGFRRDIPPLLARFDIFVLSSLSEGTSVTLLEAMAAGKPVVVTGVGGNVSLVEHNRNGFVISPRRPDELADALLLLLNNPALRRRMGEENRRKALEEFTVGTMVSRYEELYLSALSRRLPDRATVKKL